MRVSRRCQLVFVAALLLGLLSGAYSQGVGKQKQTLVIALPSEPENLNPIFMDFYFGNWKVFNGLVKYDRNLNLQPDLAARMPTISPDGRTVTVRLRDNVRFHDGRPLTAEDVVFTWRSLLDPKVATPLRGRFDLASVVQDVRALDGRTVRFTLARVDPAFLHKLYVGIVPRHLLEGKDLNTAEFNRQPVGTGPYLFKEWRPGERIVLEANPQYFDGPVGIPRVVFTFVGDENARATLLANGTVDAAGLPPKLAARFRGDARYQVIEVSSADTRLITLPSQEPSLADPRVRRALALAINRQAMVEGILGGPGEPAYGPFIRGAPAPAIPYSPDQARALLEQAGWRPGPDGIMRKGDQRLAFTLLYPAADSVRKELALAVRSDLAKIGVDVNVEGLGWEAIRSRVAAGTAGNVWGWGQPYDPDLELPQLFHSRFADDDDPFTNPARLRNRDVDAALEAGRSTLDPAKRLEAYQALQRALQEDGSYLFLVRLRPVVVLSSRIRNVEVQMEGHAHGFSRGVAWNLERWEVK